MAPSQLIRPRATTRMIRTAHAARTLMKANTVLPERPDRLPRALLASATYGTGMLGAVAASVARYPQATAIVSPTQSITYRELWTGSGAVAGSMAADAGIGSDSRIGILCRNSPTFVIALLAGARLGADLVFLNTGHGPQQLGDTIEGESLDFVLYDSEFAAALGDRPGLDSEAIAAIVSDPAQRRSLPRPKKASRLVVLTSGTTGRPKGAARGSDGQSADGALSLLDRIPLRARDSMVVPAPFFHAWGLANLMIGLGLSSTIITSPDFDAAATLDFVEQHRARTLAVVPTMLARICALPPERLAAADVDSLQIIAASGSAMPGRLAREVLDRFGPVLYNIYGSTEVAAATIATPADLRKAPTTAGRPAAGVRVEILDDEGLRVTDSTIGRVFVGSGARFDGYTDGGTKEAIDGLLSSGDRGHFDESGRLFIDGREDDMIVSGGENVYPREVEELLNHHKDIHEAIVVGVADPNFGQALKAFVVCRPGATLDPDEVKKYVTARLARFKVPRTIEFLDDLPRTATGKVLRRELV